MNCSYPDREAALVAYLYDELNGGDRVAFETHVNTCFDCRSELGDFRGVRSTLAHWSAPEAPRSLQSPVASRQSWWQQVPVWAQLAAAMLVLGVSASIANLNVTYSSAQGLKITTGWTKAAPAAANAAQPGDSAPWRAELAAMQQQLSELRSQPAAVRAASTPAPQGSMSDAELLRRVRVLVEESEKKQDQELAAHFVQLQQDFNAQRQADIRRNNQIFRDIMSTYGNTLERQQGQINHLIPASQQR